MKDAEENWASLMRASLSGDASAYRRLLTSLTPALRAGARRDCRRVGLDSGDAEDVVQEVLLALHLKRHTWDPERPIGPWIKTIARNKLIDARRRRGRGQLLPIDELADFSSDEAGDDGMDRLDVNRMLDKLGDRPRELVRALSLEGRSVQETAARFGMSEGAVRVALHRAIKALAALYREDGR